MNIFSLPLFIRYDDIKLIFETLSHHFPNQSFTIFFFNDLNINTFNQSLIKLLKKINPFGKPYKWGQIDT